MRWVWYPPYVTVIFMDVLVGVGNGCSSFNTMSMPSRWLHIRLFQPSFSTFGNTFMHSSWTDIYHTWLPFYFVVFGLPQWKSLELWLVGVEQLEGLGLPSSSFYRCELCVRPDSQCLLRELTITGSLSETGCRGNWWDLLICLRAIFPWKAQMLADHQFLTALTSFTWNVLCNRLHVHSLCGSATDNRCKMVSPPRMHNCLWTVIH